MSVVTKTGDGGMTDGNGGRIMKASPFTELVGTLDELTAQLAISKFLIFSVDIATIIETVQQHLLSMGASLYDGKDRITPDHINKLEVWVGQYERNPGGFVVPEGSASGHLHLARAICRRAERVAWGSVGPGSNISEDMLKYLNRLSDLLYVLALNQGSELPTMWSG